MNNMNIIIFYRPVETLMSDTYIEKCNCYIEISSTTICDISYYKKYY